MNHIHETLKIQTPTGEASIDKKIVPVVQWINRLKGSITIISCEGFEDNAFETDKDNGILGYAYVDFECTSRESLEYVANEARRFSGNEVQPQVEIQYIDCTDCPGYPNAYRLWLAGPSVVLEFVEHIQS